MKRVTLQDLAKATGLSVNSVSLALRGVRVSEQTQQRVREAAQQLGYVGNAQASSIRTGFTHSVAVIAGDIANPHTARVVKECVRRFRDEQYNVLIYDSEEDEALERSAIQSALRQNVDGVLISPVKKDGKNLDMLARSGVPVTAFGSICKNSAIASVCMDDEEGGYLATEHLIRQGAQRVLFVNGPLQVQGARERLHGYLRAMKARGMNMQESDVIYANLKEENSWQEALEVQLRAQKEPCAVLAYSDMLGMLIYSYCADRHLAVSGIAGFDNALTMLPSALRFPSVAEAGECIAAVAPQMLLERMRDPQDTPKHRMLPVRLYNT